MIEAVGLAKRFKKINALVDISFSFNGGVCGLVGPNGAGKSTFLRTLIGLLKADKGSVTVSGFNPFKQRESLPDTLSNCRLGVHYCRDPPVKPETTLHFPATSASRPDDR